MKNYRRRGNNCERQLGRNWGNTNNNTNINNNNNNNGANEKWYNMNGVGDASWNHKW